MIGAQAIPYVNLSEESTQEREVTPTALPRAQRDLVPSSSPTSLQSSAKKESADGEESLREKGIFYFQKLIASNLKMRPGQIKPCRSLGEYGWDSILVAQLTYQLLK